MHASPNPDMQHPSPLHLPLSRSFLDLALIYPHTSVTKPKTGSAMETPTSWDFLLRALVECYHHLPCIYLPPLCFFLFHCMRLRHPKKKKKSIRVFCSRPAMPRCLGRITRAIHDCCGLLVVRSNIRREIDYLLKKEYTTRVMTK